MINLSMQPIEKTNKKNNPDTYRWTWGASSSTLSFWKVGQSIHSSWNATFMSLKVLLKVTLPQILTMNCRQKSSGIPKFSLTTVCAPPQWLWFRVVRIHKEWCYCVATSGKTCKQRDVHQMNTEWHLMKALSHRDMRTTGSCCPDSAAQLPSVKL